jgi:hypothetical protein
VTTLERNSEKERRFILAHSFRSWTACPWAYGIKSVRQIKKNEILLFADKWMDLENIILSEVSQIQKAKSCMFSLICGI